MNLSNESIGSLNVGMCFDYAQHILTPKFLPLEHYQPIKYELIKSEIFQSNGMGHLFGVASSR